MSSFLSCKSAVIYASSSFNLSFLALRSVELSELCGNSCEYSLDIYLSFSYFSLYLSAYWNSISTFSACSLAFSCIFLSLSLGPLLGSLEKTANCLQTKKKGRMMS